MPPLEETKGGRKTRRRHRRHRGGGLLTVVQDGDVWRIRESDGSFTADSEQTFASADEAMKMVSTLKTIKRATPVQEERYDIVRAGNTLVTMKKRGGKRKSKSQRRRRHH